MIVANDKWQIATFHVDEKTRRLYFENNDIRSLNFCG
jgi:hypothetical protein